MDTKTFKEFARSMVDYIGDYHDNIRDRRVLPTVEPGYLRPLIPDEAPEEPEKWQDVMADIERVIMPGVTHWHSPSFHAYFPTANSYPAIVADMLSGAIACIGFTWIASPACTELEVVTLDWLGKLLELPPSFLACSGGKGGGVIQGTASEATLVALLGAKAKAIKKAKEEHPDWDDYKIVSKLVAYASDQAHSSVERAGLLGGVKMRLLEADADFKLRGETVARAIQEDLEAGLIPFYVVATLGTTCTCSFDCLREIGPVCNRYDVWLHVDAAYAGSAFICPETRYLMAGIDCADSFNFNPHKWMLVNFDCSAMWLKDPMYVVNAFNVDPLYLKHDQQGAAPDYRHWQIPLGRRFRSLKLWFVMRLYGANGLRKYIRHHVALAHQFEDLVRMDSRFEIVAEVLMGLVCFRLKGTNERNEALLKRINGNGKIHLVPSKVRSVYFLRFAVCSRHTESHDVIASWKEIQNVADIMLAEDGSVPGK
nr:dopa decarboxylase [Ischnura senegalensis]